MSYETNPITNRLKIAKGWKNPHFPVQTLNYSREMLLWFQIYLFLKAYLSFQQIRLLACEIRVSEKNTKILYLSVSKERKEEKKNTKSKWKSKSLLYALKSSLTKVQTQDARFLLYQDFKSLKKISSSAVNSSQKKILSKTWLTKSRNSSWMNTAYLISKTRNQFRSKQQLYRKQKTSRHSLTFQEKESNYKQKFWRNKQRQIFSVLAKIQKEVFFLEKSLRFLPTLADSEKPLHWKNLLENLIAQHEKKKLILSKLKKIYSFSFQSNIRLQKKEQILSRRLSSKIRKQQIRNKLKLFWLNLKKELISLKKQTLFFQNKPHYFLIWKNKFWKSSRFCVPTNLKLRNTILNLYFLYGPKTKNLVQQLFSLNKKNVYWMKYMLKGLIFAQPNLKDLSGIKLISKKDKSFVKPWVKSVSNIKPQKKTLFYHKTKFNRLVKNIWKRKLVSLTQTRILTKKKKLFSLQTLRLIRFHQKTPQKRSKRKKSISRRFLRSKANFWKKSIQKGSKGLLRPKDLALRQQKLKRISLNSLKQKLKYRLPYRREYKTQLKFFTNWRLKYLIQDLIQEYFAIRLYVKLLWPLSEFKNLKFFRIVFPKKRNQKTHNVSLETKIYTKQLALRKRYVFVSQVSNHIRLKNAYRFEKKQRVFLKKIKRVLNLPFRKKSGKKQQFVLQAKGKNQKIFSQINAKNSQKKFLTYKVIPNASTWKNQKKNAYLSRKLKMLQVQGQKRLHWAAKARFMSNLVTTLTLFAKYLDPQPLADALAKVIGNTKKHVSALKLVENVLRTLNFQRGVGYRIGLTGRANGAEKSHVMYLRKLNRNRPRQTFSKNVNFAMAQARATIGTFGIKIWVYY